MVELTSKAKIELKKWKNRIEEGNLDWARMNRRSEGYGKSKERGRITKYTNYAYDKIRFIEYGGFSTLEWMAFKREVKNFKNIEYSRDGMTRKSTLIGKSNIFKSYVKVAESHEASTGWSSSMWSDPSDYVVTKISEAEYNKLLDSKH